MWAHTPRGVCQFKSGRSCYVRDAQDAQVGLFKNLPQASMHASTAPLPRCSGFWTPSIDSLLQVPSHSSTTGCQHNPLVGAGVITSQRLDQLNSRTDPTQEGPFWLPAHRACVLTHLLLCRVCRTVSPPLRPVWRAARATLVAWG